MTNSHGVLRGLLLCGGAIAVLAGAGSAHAQVSTAPSEGTALEEVLMTTLKPSATLTGKIEGTYGTYNDVSLGGYVSGPINDKVRYSLSAYGRKTPGYYDLLDAKGVKIGDDAAQIYDVTVRSKLEAD